MACIAVELIRGFDTSEGEIKMLAYAIQIMLIPIL